MPDQWEWMGMSPIVERIRVKKRVMKNGAITEH